MFNTFRKLSTDKKGATAIEYGLIAALIAIAMISGLIVLGQETSNTMNAVSEGFDRNDN
ncbi:Flp family type IVb pilin [Sphingorhabdus sp. Alg239-R122]|uniref:Flp family type IVb pilin n=1 Tax=Sphingorhabdus sp. Alg239-R122 TaxID=2305989 RepID=UPI0013DA6BC0|nr:Flp family type IVb pilin [Sphingorhabdus sp. Alg239-R122]